MSSAITSHRNALIVLAVLAVLYGLVSFPNHALLRTYALDLGLYTHVMWHYANGRIHDSSLFLEEAQPILADHFDLYLPLFSPLIHITGTWTLLVLQWIAILTGIWGVRKFLLTIELSQRMGLVGMIIAGLFYGIFAALAFDYHSNVVAAMILPWCLFALFKGRRLLAIGLFVFMLIGKENMGFWLGPVALIVGFHPKMPIRSKYLSIAMGAFGLIYSSAIIGIVMPSLSQDGMYAHFDYSLLGSSSAGLPKALIERPAEMIEALFLDHRGVSRGTDIKLEFWWMLMLSGGWALFFQPRWGLMALPLLAQKMWHDDPGKWSVIAQYGVEFAPLIGIAVPIALSRITITKQKQMLITLAIIAGLACLIRFMDRTNAYHDRSRIRIYQAQHYVKPYPLDVVRDLLASIPPNASISAQSPAVPHLALRDRLYQFPIIRDAEYIVLLPLESTYPLDRSSYRSVVAEIKQQEEWRMVMETDEVLLLQRAIKRAEVAAP